MPATKEDLRDYHGGAGREIPTIGTWPLAKLPKVDERLAYAFPEADPPYLPLGKMIVVQLRTPGDFKILPNGQKFYFTDETQAVEKFNVQTGLVRMLGPVAYKNRLTLGDFPEGAWCKPGDFVRVPKYGGDRVAVPTKDDPKREAMFLIVNDIDVIGLVNGDPLAIKGIL